MKKQEETGKRTLGFLLFFMTERLVKGFSGKSFAILYPMVFAEFFYGSQPGLGHGLNPLGGVHVALHNKVADRLIGIAQGKYQKEGSAKSVVGAVDKASSS